MIDREKVIKHLKAYVDCYSNRHSMCDPDCALYGHGDCAKYAVEYISDALVLLKEQEPITPSVCGSKEPDGHGSWWYLCGTCKKPIDHKDRFCKRCGQGVKWDD